MSYIFLNFLMFISSCSVTAEHSKRIYSNGIVSSYGVLPKMGALIIIIIIIIVIIIIIHIFI